MVEWDACPVGINGHDGGDRFGNCTWCGKKVNSAVARPDRFDASELTDWYGMYYDPDWEATFDWWRE